MTGEANARGGAGEHATFLSTRVFGSLDGLRAVAILAVLWHHAGGSELRTGIAARGFLGVDLFFVVSGFLIATLLLRERARTGSISLRAFYWRRALRIFPAYYLMLGVVGASALAFRGRTADATLHDLPIAATYLSNMFPVEGLLAITWSLAAEEQFYLVAPALERRAPRQMPALIAIAWLLVTIPALGAFPSLRLPAFFREATFGPILLGVGLAHLLNAERGFRLAFHAVGGRIVPPVALAATLLAASARMEDISGFPRLLIHGCMVVLVASCVVRESHVLRPALAFPPLRRLGIVSYGIYLYHMLVLHVATRVMGVLRLSGSGWTFLLLLAGSWLVAEVSFRWFEARFLALKERSPWTLRRA